MLKLINWKNQIILKFLEKKEKNNETGIVSNSINIKKVNKNILPQIFEHLKDDICRWKSRSRFEIGSKIWWGYTG